MRHLLVVVMALVGIVGCTRQGLPERLEPEEVSYLALLDSVETTFSLPVEVSDVAWDRAQSFIDRFSALQLHTRTDAVIETYRPDPNGLKCGYIISRRTEGNDVVFTVDCLAPSNAAIEDVDRNKRIVAHYMQTGELPPDRRLVTR
jgi:hypothetical protein